MILSNLQGEQIWDRERRFSIDDNIDTYYYVCWYTYLTYVIGAPLVPSIKVCRSEFLFKD